MNLRFKRSAYFYVEITGDFEHFQCLDFETIFLKKENLFLKTRIPFLVESTTIKVQHFHGKLPCQKLMLRQRMGLFTKNAVLPLTILFFWKFYLSIRTCYKELVECTNFPNFHIHTFRRHLSFIWRCVFPGSIPKQKSELFLVHSPTDQKSDISVFWH